jgi:PTS system nitrogen regulatory IIA component
MGVMHISEILRPTMVMPSVTAANKGSLLTAMVHHAATYGPWQIHSESSVLDAIMHREELGSTGVGGGVAIPHAKIPMLDHLLGVFARIPEGINFDSTDGSPVTLVFMHL